MVVCKCFFVALFIPYTLCRILPWNLEDDCQALGEALSSNGTLRTLEVYQTGLCNESFNAIVGRVGLRCVFLEVLLVVNVVLAI